MLIKDATSWLSLSLQYGTYKNEDVALLAKVLKYFINFITTLTHYAFFHN